MTQEEALAFQKRLQKDYQFFNDRGEQASQPGQLRQGCALFSKAPRNAQEETEIEEVRQRWAELKELYEAEESKRCSCAPFRD